MFSIAKFSVLLCCPLLFVALAVAGTDDDDDFHDAKVGFDAQAALLKLKVSLLKLRQLGISLATLDAFLALDQSNAIEMAIGQSVQGLERVVNMPEFDTLYRVDGMDVDKREFTCDYKHYPNVMSTEECYKKVVHAIKKHNLDEPIFNRIVAEMHMHDLTKEHILMLAANNRLQLALSAMLANLDLYFGIHKLQKEWVHRHMAQSGELATFGKNAVEMFMCGAH